MSVAYQITVTSLIICPLALIILYLVMAGIDCNYQIEDLSKSNKTSDDNSNLISTSDCHVTNWSRWSSCTCLQENFMYRTRVVRSNYDLNVYRNDPCSDIDAIQYIKCQDSDCGKSEYCNITKEQENYSHCNAGKIVTYWYFNPYEFSCTLTTINDCIDINNIKNKFPSLHRCEELCFFQEIN